MRLLVILAALVAPAPLAAQEASRPNVVLIVADDLGVEGIGAYGGASYGTPRIDALAAAGTRFDACFSTPLCTPSRVQLLTGRYPFRTGWTRLIGARADTFDVRQERTIAQLMRKAGYVTAVAGKWQLAHLGENPHHVTACGFERSRVWTWIPRAGGVETARYWDPAVWENGAAMEVPDGSYGPDLFCEFVCDFVREERDEPFFALYTMVLPHAPFVPPPIGERVPPVRLRQKSDPEHFGAMVRHVDVLVGRVYDALEEAGKLENTLVLFTADNGSPEDVEAELRGAVIRGGKGKLSDAGTHVPLIAHWPGRVPADRAVDTLVDFSDFFPTLLELGGADAPADVVTDGVSFVPALLDRDGPEREWVYCQVADGWYLRDRHWRLDSKGRVRRVTGDPLLETEGEGDPEAQRERLLEIYTELRFQ